MHQIVQTTDTIFSVDGAGLMLADVDHHLLNAAVSDDRMRHLEELQVRHQCRGRHQAKGDDLGVLLRPDGDRTVASRSYSGVTRAAGNASDRDSAPTHEADAAEVIRRADQRQHVLVRTLPGSGRGEPFLVVVLRCEVGVDPPLYVHVFPDREPLGHRHHGAQLAAEVAGDPERELRGPGVLGQRPDPDLEQQAEAARQPPEILGVRRPEGWGYSPGQQCPSTVRVPRGYRDVGAPFGPALAPSPK